MIMNQCQSALLYLAANKNVPVAAINTATANKNSWISDVYVAHPALDDIKIKYFILQMQKI